MDFPSELRRGRLVQRYKRFFADVVLDDGSEVEAKTKGRDDVYQALSGIDFTKTIELINGHAFLDALVDN